jgi:hypothetical protein
MDTIRVMGLTRLDGLELKDTVPDADLKFEQASGNDEQHGELATWAIVVLADEEQQARLDRAQYHVSEKQWGNAERDF